MNTRRASLVGGAAAAVVATGLITSNPGVDGLWHSAVAAADEPPAPSPSPAGSAPVPGVEKLIAALTIVDELPEVSGYSRDCGRGDGCVFGTAWTDDYDGVGARNGCDTRNDVLGDQLIDVKYKPGTGDCKVLSGTLNDPYTGREIAFTSGKSTSSAVQIDHIFPLARSWRAGAAHWPLGKRVAFANDIELNLLASDGPANQAKSDKGLDEWLPPNTAYQCTYAIKYLTVAAAYDLAITSGDAAAARTACR
ncbi:MAG: HNH endonuclease family protein [Rhodococcus sp. (in: high G+C Gram-positive bacteria)]|uniref:HNH endonuclease family protein n=1 Tax=Rhodococcus sp. TaxID=1831 RepID=UPI003BB10893